MTVRTGLLAIGVCLLVVLAGCAGGDGSTEPTATDIVDTYDSTPTPTSQDRVESETGSATPTGTTGASTTPTAEADSPTDASGPTDARTSTPTDSPSPTATATATPAPTETPTQSETATPTPTETVTSTATATPTPNSPGRTATVVDVIDGDTVKLRFSDGSRDTARLLGVDTPETTGPVAPEEWEGVPDTEAGRSCLSDWGGKATQFTTAQLYGETVRVTFDENEPKRGYYDRLLVYVHVDGELFNDDLVKRGYARVYTDSQFTKKGTFLDYEAAAQSANRGAWTCRDVATATPSPTATSASSSAGGSDALVVDEIHEDAPGNDHENENEEWIRFRNAGDTSLDISGWTVSDAADHTYHVPAGTVLDPGAMVTLYTGSGTDTADALYWGSDAAIWNNDGDTVVVRTDEGDPVLERAY